MWPGSLHSSLCPPSGEPVGWAVGGVVGPLEAGEGLVGARDIAHPSHKQRSLPGLIPASPPQTDRSTPSTPIPLREGWTSSRLMIRPSSLVYPMVSRTQPSLSQSSTQTKAQSTTVGDFFQSWDDFRQYARQGAEARGFSLSQSQSKGSSGTIVLRCSKFKHPGTAGQKMAEDGCEVVFKVMKAKNGHDGYEVVQSYKHHNHAYGLNNPSNSSQPGPATHRKKKLKTSAHDSRHPSTSIAHAPTAASTPPRAPAAPKPFLFDPYTGKPLRTSNTPAPIQNTTPSPPHLDPIHYPLPVPTAIKNTKETASYQPNTTYATVPSPARPSVRPPQEPSYGVDSSAAQVTNTRGVKRQASSLYEPNTSNSKIYPPLTIRLSVKAQNSITEFLSSLSNHLSGYAPHFVWIGIKSPLDLLEICDRWGEDEVEMFLNEIDTAGLGATGEGLNEDEKILILRGLRKLKSIQK